MSTPNGCRGAHPAGDAAGAIGRCSVPPAPGAAWWQPWAALALFAFLLNFAWEMGQAPFYRGMATAPHGTAVRACALATVGDVTILLLAYALVAAVAHRRWWLAAPTAGRVAGFVAVGLAATVGLELLNVYVLGRWAYGEEMPRVLGVGLAPLLQWVLLPPAVLWLARRHLGWMPGRLSPFTGTHA